MSTRSRTTTGWLAIVIALTFLTAACGGAERDESGEIVEEGEVSAFSLKVGDCLNPPEGDDGQVNDVTGVPCEEPHDAQVFALFDVEFDEFPSEDLMAVEAENGCLIRFEDFMGISYEESLYYFYTLTPSPESWEHDDREVACLLVEGEGEKITGDLRGSGL